MDLIPQEVSKRASELSDLIDDFIRDWNLNDDAAEIVAIDGGAKKVADQYFEILLSVIKIYLPEGTNANKFKVAAGTEFACMFVMPIRFKDPLYKSVDIRRLNASFAFYAAQTMLFWIYFNKGVNKIKDPTANLQQVFRNHLIWLQHLNTKSISSLPTLLNANFWEAYLLASSL